MISVLMTISLPLRGDLLREYAVIVAIAAALALCVLIAAMVLKKNKACNKPAAGLLLDYGNREATLGLDYHSITERILRFDSRYKTVLFAAAGLKCLPVTVPVNVAIQLAEKQKQCLLIDLDLKRNAVAKAFDIDEHLAKGDFRPKPCPADVKNLWIWPGHYFTQTRQMNIKQIVAAAVKTFDIVLINVPYLDGNCDRRQIASASESAFLFTQNPKQTQRLTELLQTANCKLIATFQTPTQ